MTATGDHQPEMDIGAFRLTFAHWSLAAWCVLAAGCGAADTVDLAGRVEREVLELAAPTSETIVELPLAEGERVEAGQIVVQLDTEVGAAELRAAEAAGAAASAMLVETEREFSRQTELRRSRVTAPQALDAARRKRDEALAEVAERDARIAQARKRFEDLTVRSLVVGVVDQLPYKAGERAPAGGVVAVLMADEEPWVRVWLPARSVARTNPGSKAEVRVEGIETPFEGTLFYVSREPAFTPHYALTEREGAHLVYEAKVRIESAPADLRPGLSAQVRLRLPGE